MKLHDGIFYPDSEKKLHRHGCCVGHISLHILPHIEKFGRVVQAGGAAGAWPIEFSKHFAEVFTFEPNPALFECLLRNTHGKFDNIHPVKAALWESEGKGVLNQYEANNMGSWYITKTEDGDIPLIPVDSLDLDNVDLIQFDVEGGEIEALKGARETIAVCKPVIVLEVKGTQQFYGRTVQDVDKFMRKLRYKLVHKFGRDQLWVPIAA